jgi:hypothetical protein
MVLYMDCTTIRIASTWRPPSIHMAGKKAYVAHLGDFAYPSSCPAWDEGRYAKIPILTDRAYLYILYLIMHVLIFGLIFAFLFTATHVLVDHGSGGQQPFALLPHPGPSHGQHDAALDTPHDHESEPSPEHDPHQHQADTHSHEVWSTPADGKHMRDIAPSVLPADMAACPSGGNPCFPRGTLPTPPPRGCLLYLRCSVLRI